MILKYIHFLLTPVLFFYSILFIAACGSGADVDNTPIQFANAVNINKYGANGKDKQDDTEAFKKAFAQETSVLIPAGHYYLSKALLIPENLQVITGTGTLIGTDTQGIFKTDKTSKGINKLIINGIGFQYQPTQDTPFGAIYFNDSDVKNLTIQNCHFTAPKKAKWGNAITLVGKKGHRVDNIVITNNRFTNITRAAIEVMVRGEDKTKSTEFPEWPAVNFDKTIVTNLSISNNTFRHDFGAYHKTNKKGEKEIFNPAISLSGAVNNTKIDNNTINGFYWGVELDGSTRTRISNNKISSKHSSISLSHGSDTLANQTFIEGNTLTAKAEEGIYVINAHEAKSITIRKNHITGLIYLRNTDNFILKENKLYSNLFANLMIDNSSNTLVTENYIENTHANSIGSIRGKPESGETNKVINNSIYVKSGKNLENHDRTAILFKNNTTHEVPQRNPQ